MIRVEREERAISPAQTEAALAALGAAPGVWMGCDVAAEGLYRRESMACAAAALRFCLDGDELQVTPLSATGAALAEAAMHLAPFRQGEHGLRVKLRSGAEVIALLRAFLAQFEPRSRELALFGAFAFDYYRLGSTAALPADGRRRMVLFLPERILASDQSGAREVGLRFGVRPGAEPAAPIAAVAAPDEGDELAPGAHAARVAAGVERLRRGELYCLVLSQAFRRRTRVAPLDAFAALRRRNPYPAMFYCNLGGGEILFGASPDLQVRADARSVESAPVCGTLRRGADPAEDAEQALALLASDKEGAAIALCADSAASEHAAVCEPGSVEVISHRRAHFFSTIVHAISHLRGRRRAGLDAFDVLLAHATPATVTGLPKPAAVRAIDELEAGWRGWYAGAVARLGSDGSLEAYTVLRAARVAGGVAEIRTGGNILADSDPRSEEAESRLKAQTLFRVLDLEDVAAPVPAKTRWALREPEGDDPFRDGLRNALARAGGAFCAETGGRRRIAVLSGAPVAGSAPDGPLLAVGEGALWLLERDGAVSERLERPEFARVVRGSAARDGFLRALGEFHAGWYATRAIRTGTLPRGWKESAVSKERWVLAAEHSGRNVCALLFRPDSVLSLYRDSGTKGLSAAMARLDHGMFAVPPNGEKP